MRARVEAARNRQRQQFSIEETPSTACNADMMVAEVRQFCKLDAAVEGLVRAEMARMNLSARDYHRILRLARTFADLAGCDTIQVAHVAEALQHRPMILG